MMTVRRHTGSGGECLARTGATEQPFGPLPRIQANDSTIDPNGGYRVQRDGPAVTVRNGAEGKTVQTGCHHRG